MNRHTVKGIVVPETVHLTGILGSGMSALARLYLERGIRVSGSDDRENGRLATLISAGAEISIGLQHATTITAQQVIFSPAVPRTHPDLVEARRQNLPSVSRARALSDLIRDKETICVAGSHGKTTTTALLAWILDQGGIQPGFMIGEDCPVLDNRNARWSDGPVFVNESCEAFRALDHWQPSHCIVTNVDDEHSEHYGSFANLQRGFADFIGKVPAGGKVFIGADCLRALAAAQASGAEYVTFGFSEQADWQAKITKLSPLGQQFEVWEDGARLGHVWTKLAGQHNVLNALGAIALSASFGVPFKAAALAVENFEPMSRRWQYLGTTNGVRVFDDMAHHPAEISVTLDVAQACAGTGNVLVVLQPQLHSRVTRLAHDFAQSLKGADQVILLPLDSAGEPQIGAGGDAALAAALGEMSVRYTAARDAEDASRIAAKLAQPGDLIVTIGAAVAQRVGFALQADPALVGGDLADKSLGDCREPTTAKPNELLHADFELMAAKYPDAACVVEEHKVWTYAQIDQMAETVAQNLAHRGLGRENLVVLQAGRSARLVALIIGTLKAGCAFVPIDPSMIRPGTYSFLRQVQAGLIIHDNMSGHVPERTIPAATFDEMFEPPSSEPRAGYGPLSKVTGRNLAYAIFTSGSTGTPKLVGVEHHSVSNLIRHSVHQLLDPEDLELIPFLDSIGFDACVHQIFTPLSIGGSLLLAADFHSLIHSRHFKRITGLGGTPTVIGQLAEAHQLPNSLRYIALGGEVTPKRLVSKLSKMDGITKILNFFGPTETTIYTTVAHLFERSRPKGQQITDGDNIGFVHIGARVYILDEQGQQASPGDSGEICITGSGVARGYLGAPHETAKRFVPDPFGSSPQGRMYRTGDLGLVLPDGSIQYLGRIDEQIKVNGVRIDPVEIEIQISSFHGVESSAVVSIKDSDGRGSLIGFITSNDFMDPNLIRAAMADRLPKAMVPRSIIQLDELPTTANGKLDRAALIATTSTGTETSASVASLDGVEKRLLEIWRSVLRRPSLTAEQDFFDAGGDSLATMQMVLTAEKEFGVRLPAQALENIGTAFDLAGQIREQMASPKSVATAEINLVARILAKQRAFVAAWPCERGDRAGFLRSKNIEGHKPALFWSFQGYYELKALAEALGPDQPVHGMRSGHQIIQYTPETIAALAHQYAEEMMELQPSGAFRLGGNCQGATIARATALTLRSKGRDVETLILMEQAGVWPYDQPVGLIFGRESSHNPFGFHHDPTNVFDAAYPQGHAIQLCDGGHGEFFSAENVPSLARTINVLLNSKSTLG